MVNRIDYTIAKANLAWKLLELYLDGIVQPRVEELETRNKRIQELYSPAYKTIDEVLPDYDEGLN